MQVGSFTIHLQVIGKNDLMIRKCLYSPYLIREKINLIKSIGYGLIDFSFSLLFSSLYIYLNEYLLLFNRKEYIE
jgi:hypothetical protein